MVNWTEAAYEHIWRKSQSPTEEIHNVTCLPRHLCWRTVLIRDEYVKLWEYVQEKRLSRNSNYSGLVVMGQSGIGEHSQLNDEVANASIFKANLSSCCMHLRWRFRRRSLSCSVIYLMPAGYVTRKAAVSSHSHAWHLTRSGRIPLFWSIPLLECNLLLASSRWPDLKDMLCKQLARTGIAGTRGQKSGQLWAGLWDFGQRTRCLNCSK